MWSASRTDYQKIIGCLEIDGGRPTEIGQNCRKFCELQASLWGGASRNGNPVKPILINLISILSPEGLLQTGSPHSLTFARDDACDNPLNIHRAKPPQSDACVKDYRTFDSSGLSFFSLTVHRHSEFILHGCKDPFISFMNNIFSFIKSLCYYSAMN